VKQSIRAFLEANLPPSPMHCDVVTVGGLFYEHRTAARLTQFLRRSVANGCKALIGDPCGPACRSGSWNRSQTSIWPRLREKQESGSKSKVFSFSPFY
jgi:predicted nicotinamide N-methyase